MIVSKMTYIAYFENLRDQLCTQDKLERPILQFRLKNMFIDRIVINIQFE